MTNKRTEEKKKEIWTIPCIPGYRVMYKGTDVATVKKNGEVMWGRDLGKVSSAHPYGKSYADILPAGAISVIYHFSSQFSEV